MGESRGPVASSASSASTASSVLRVISCGALAIGASCTQKTTRRAGVGGEVPPGQQQKLVVEPGRTGTPVETPASTASSKEPAVQPSATAGSGSGAKPEETPAGPVTQAHPFTGKAYGAFNLETSERVFQTDLKYKRPYYYVMKLAGEEAWFLYPSIRHDPKLVSLCASQPAHELVKEFGDTYCKQGTSDAVKLKKDVALKAAKTLNDAMKYTHGSWTQTTPATWRVNPSPHFHEMDEVCEEQKSGPLGAFCSTYLRNKEEAASRGFVLFETENEAKYMAISFNSVYGIPVR